MDWVIIGLGSGLRADRSLCEHCSDVIMSAMASQISGVSIVCSVVCSGADQRKHQRSASLTFVVGIHRWPVDSPHKGPVTRKMFKFDNGIIRNYTTRDQKLLLTASRILLDKYSKDVVWNIYLYVPNTTVLNIHITLANGFVLLEKDIIFCCELR